MIVYSDTKERFVNDVRQNVIHTKLLKTVRELGLPAGSPGEVESWRNSMQFMRNVVDAPEIPNNAGISIEYAIPLTSKRIDFIISGKDEIGTEHAVIIELKQWSKVEKTNKDGVVSTYVGQRVREVSHPSYQAWTYAALINDYNETVRQEDIQLKPCAYLHNLDSDSEISDPCYQHHIDRAPIFAAADTLKLQDFVKRYVSQGDNTDIMYRIENGRIRPSKALADELTSLLVGNPSFLMIDDQKIVYETALAMVQANREDKKQVLIVKGGPGTGKSVVAINLLVELTNRGNLVQYVSKNQAPREVYAAKLSGTMRKNRINNLFKGSSSYTGVEPHSFDALIVDEAHRLMEKNRYNRDSDNQAKELIQASKTSIFLLDEDQIVTWADIGREQEVVRWAEYFGAAVVRLDLASQFRCSGSDGYLAWLDHVLQIRETANFELTQSDFEFQVFADPNKLRTHIRSLNTGNKARLVAGYCWDWISDSRKKKNDPSAMDIRIPEFGFAAQWNLADDGSLWLIAPESVEQIGCIHTCQGLELDHVGVIIGPDLMVRDGRIVTDASQRSKMDSSIRGYKKLLNENPEKASAKADRIIKNTYRTLLTRGQKSCSIYCCDHETEEYFRAALRQQT
ncbi:MAG: DUF2075 domain-containing protein [Pseudomonadales bacterium]|nr:DUF2075 domain-containing protein [Pseudomonadales bacterium]MBO7005048.1 DUF2075 domain-containing protein [Pseudomonadales bacterium]